MVHASTAHVGAVGPMQAQYGCECHLQLQGWASHQAALVRAADQVARPIMPVGSYDDYAGMLWSAARTRAAWWPVHPCSWSCTPRHSVPAWRAPVPACAVDARTMASGSTDRSGYLNWQLQSSTAPVWGLNRRSRGSPRPYLHCQLQVAECTIRIHSAFERCRCPNHGK